MDSDGCQVRRTFYAKKTIPNPARRILYGFTINCTTQTLYKVGYSSGGICGCGEYLLNKNESHRSVRCQPINLTHVNFTVEISVENVRNPEGGRCTFSFIVLDGDNNFDVRIMPENVSTSVQPSPTTSEVLPSGSDGDNYDTDEPPTVSGEPPTGTEYWFLSQKCTVVVKRDYIL